GLAIVARQMQYPNPRIALGDTVECCRRAIPRAVIGKNDLGGLRQPVERVGQRPIEFGERLHLVVDRNDDRNVHTAPPSRRRTPLNRKVIRKSFGKPAYSGVNGDQRRGRRGRGKRGGRYCWTRVARKPASPCDW